MEEKQCKGEHSVHICQLASEKKFEEIRAIAKDSNFMCMNCGRVAAVEKNLCYPIAFNEIESFKKMYVCKQHNQDTPENITQGLSVRGFLVVLD